MKHPLLAVPLFLVLVALARAETVVYETDFGTVDFPSGSLADSAAWRNLSSDTDAVVEITGQSPSGGGGNSGRYLHLVRPASGAVPSARVQFAPRPEGFQEPFDVFIRLAAQAASHVFTALTIVGDSGTGSFGAFAGVTKSGGTRGGGVLAPCVLPTPETEVVAGAELEPGKFYDFHFAVNPRDQNFSVTISADGKVLAEKMDVALRGHISRFNAITFRIPGGKSGDAVFVDSLKVSRP